MSFPPNKPQKLKLNTKRLTTIMGENLDVGGNERNGTGKSAIIDAILYLYFGKTPRISNQGLLNYIEPGPMYVTGAASRGDTAFLVERGDNPSIIRLYEKPAADPRDFKTKEDGKPIFETSKTKPETTKRIIELLGFDLKLTDILLLNNPSERACFFLKTQEEQRDIVERIFGFTIFTEKAERLRQLRKQEKLNLTTKESALIATKQANDRIMVEIADLEQKANTWAAERDKLFKFLSQQINSYKDVDFDHQISVLTNYDELKSKLLKAEQEQKAYLVSFDVLKAKRHEWDAQRTRTVENINQTIDSFRKIDAAAEIDIIQTRLQIEADIDRLIAELDAAKRERDPYRQALAATFNQKTRLAQQINIIEKQIIELNEYKCPTCGQDWADTRDHILKCINELDAQNEENSKLDGAIADLKAKIRTIDANKDKLAMQTEGLMQKLAQLPDTSFKTVEEAAKASISLDEQVQRLNETKLQQNPHTDLLNETQTKVAQYDTQRETLRSALNELPKTRYEELSQAINAKKDLENLRSQFVELQQTENPYRGTIDNLRHKAMKAVNDAEVRELSQRVQHMDLLIDLLTDRDSPIRKAVLAEWLPELNNRINGYLELLELPHRISFDPNMTATFIVPDKNLGLRTIGFGNLSNGQRLRVWLATNRAFREIFELINYPIDLFFVDELLDKGMSPRGAEVSYRLLQQMVEQNRSVFLITHRPELTDLADEIVTITLENGLSTIIH